jgi:hypothetical protein
VITTIYLVSYLLSLTAAGWTTIRLLDKQNQIHRNELWFPAFLTGSIILYILVSIIGPFSFSTTTSICIIIAMLIFGTFSLSEMRKSIKILCKTLQITARGDKLTLLYGTLIFFSMCLTLIQAFAPPNDYDSINYHLAIPVHDLEKGRIDAAWYKGNFAFFPSLAEHQVRITLAIAGIQATQVITWIFGLFLLIGTFILSYRLSRQKIVATLAVLLLISTRIIIGEIATCYVEIQLACFSVLAYISYENFRRNDCRIWVIVFAIAIAGGVLVKYIAFVLPLCFLPLIVHDLVKKRVSYTNLILLIFIVILLLAPHCVRNYYYTGNPVFPLGMSIFNPNMPSTLPGLSQDIFGRERNILNFLRIFWDISILPTHLFDGAMLGSPYFLVFLPFALFAGSKNLLPLCIIILGYVAAWHWGMTRQVRFLVPIMPFVAIIASIGACQLSLILQGKIRWFFHFIVGILVLNQSLFVAVYAALRIPAAIGIVSASEYHNKTPAMNGSHFEVCEFIKRNLTSGASYVSILIPHSSYCPQSSAIIPPVFPEQIKGYFLNQIIPEELKASELAAEFAGRHVEFVAVTSNAEFRSGPDSAPYYLEMDISLGTGNMGKKIKKALEKLTPVYADKYNAVYSGSEVIKTLSELD